MWIKICGIRDVEAARAAAAGGADAVGLNFYDASPRCVSIDTAAKIVAALPATVEPIGVFVNHSTEEIRRTCEACGLSVVQLHGDEPASILAELEGLRVIRALRAGGDVKKLVEDGLRACERLGTAPWAWLIDAYTPHVYGGSGETVDWEAFGALARDLDLPRLILAGGLTPQNVAAAIRTARPWGVDVASGVESSPGVKDPSLIDAFIRCARPAS